MAKNNEILDRVKNILPSDEQVLDYHKTTSGERRKETPRLYLSIHTNKRNLFVKYSLKEDTNIFQREYDALVKLEENGFITPKPIGLIDRGIILTFVGGKPIEENIIQSGLSKNLDLLIDAIFQISKFHIKHICNPREEDVDEIYKKITGATISIKQRELIRHTKFGFTHGDLDPFNTFFDPKKRKFGLIDWEDFREDGIQILDVIHFIVMLGVIVNPKCAHDKLYEKIFNKYEGNVYLHLLKVYSQETKTSFSEILRFIPTYCDAQNYRLNKANRDTTPFLYNKFKEIYYEREQDI